jgi:dTMP kinase
VGLLVTFEGPEGGGKTTQSRWLHRRLVALGYEAVLTREPGGTTLGEAVRDWILELANDELAPQAEALLHTAARAQHVASVIRPALARGAIVVCDRFADSTLAYQGGGRGLDERTLRALQEFATQGVWPDLTILIDVPVEVGLARRQASGEPLTRLDREGVAFHERVRAWYRMAAAREPERWQVVDGQLPAEDVANQVWSAVAPRLAHLHPVG